MPIDRVVVNASPLITLFKSQLADLLASLFQEILVPSAVWEEIMAAGAADPAAQQLPTVAWARRIEAVALPPEIIAWDLGAGESEVLNFSRQHPEYRAVVDDAAARRCARALSIPVLGTGGILVLAKRCGVIPAVAPCLEALRQAGLWLSDELVRVLKQQAGE